MIDFKHLGLRRHYFSDYQQQNRKGNYKAIERINTALISLLAKDPISRIKILQEKKKKWSAYAGCHRQMQYQLRASARGDSRAKVNYACCISF